MNFQREKRSGVKPAVPAVDDPKAEAFSRFYAELVQTSGARWAGAAAKGESAGQPEQQQTEVAASSAQQQALDRTTITPTGVVILESSRSQQAATPTAGHEPDQTYQQAPVSTQYGIGRHNVGYTLLQKAGWKEGTGLGAQEQGRKEPLAPALVQGQAGLGFQLSLLKNRRKPAGQGSEASMQQQGGNPLPHQQQQQQQPAPKRPLPPDPLEKEVVDTKVKRVKQVLQTEADEEAGKAIQRYIYMAFNDATGEATSDSNPLLRRGRSKLSATNPLL